MKVRLGRAGGPGDRDLASLVGTAGAEPILQAVARRFVARRNQVPERAGATSWLHLGCGDNVLPGFLNVDFTPSQPTVAGWDLMSPWPVELGAAVEGIFCEDLFEHFYHDEQVYMLCAANAALRPGRVLRLMMPDLRRLVRRYSGAAPAPPDWLGAQSGMRTPADAVNFGMRMGGHRWLHDEASVAGMARRAGFRAVPTSCADSLEPRFAGLGIRDETNSLSFATDLVKEESLRFLRLEPATVEDAEPLTRLGGADVYRATSDDPKVVYRLPEAIESDAIVLLAFRVANLSQHEEHSYAQCYLEPDEATTIVLDASLRSAEHSMMVSYAQIQARAPGLLTRTVRLDPARNRGDLFTAGPLEVYWRQGLPDPAAARPPPP